MPQTTTLKKIPHTYAITALLIIFCAILTWLVPAGEFVRETIVVEGSERTVIVPGSFHYVDGAPQSWEIFGVLLRGFERQPASSPFCSSSAALSRFLPQREPWRAASRAFCAFADVPKKSRSCVA